MPREVLFTRKAEQAFVEAFNWYAERSVDAAGKWHAAVTAAVATLEHSADRCPAARERDRFSIDLRQHVFAVGAKPTHRLVFAIRNERVVVYAIRHLAQADLAAEDI